MEELNDLILFENENTRLDFKRDVYRKENYPSFLKDIISMSNANSNEIKYIIIGLKPKSQDDRGIKGIDDELTDSATFQQLVHENIEPEINIEYFPYKHDDYILGVFKIYDCNNPPYLMKKDFGNDKNKLFRGEGFIRKGSHQTRLLRKDYDRYTQQKNDEKYFNEELKFSIVIDDIISQVIKLKSIEELQLPSEINKEKIEKILIEKRKTEDNNIKLGMPHLNNFVNPLSILPIGFGGGGSLPYEKRSIKDLEDNLKNIKETYKDHDYYEVLELQSNKFNISILNNGHNYIKDASIVVKIPRLEGLFISDKIIRNPRKSDIIGQDTMSIIHYPKVTENDEFYIIKNSIGDIKHQKEQNAFDKDIRIFANRELEGIEFEITCELFAENIKTAILQNLIVKTK